MNCTHWFPPINTFHAITALLTPIQQSKKRWQQNAKPMTDSQNKNESRLKSAGLRMALKLLPPDLLNAAPQHLENYLKEKLRQVDPERHELGACYLIAPHAQDGHLRVMTVTLDEQDAVSRIVSETTLEDIFASILDNMKEL